MLKVIMTDDKLDGLMKLYKEEKRYGKMKYLWEIAVPDKEEASFYCWLEKCEKLGFDFAFAILERYNDYQLMYGFSDFDIPERKGIKCLQLNFENDDIMYQQFIKWQEESACFLLPITMKFALELNKKLSGEISEFELYDDGSYEQALAIKK